MATAMTNFYFLFFFFLYFSTLFIIFYIIVDRLVMDFFFTLFFNSTRNFTLIFALTYKNVSLFEIFNCNYKIFMNCSIFDILIYFKIITYSTEYRIYSIDGFSLDSLPDLTSHIHIYIYITRIHTNDPHFSLVDSCVYNSCVKTIR